MNAAPHIYERLAELLEYPRPGTPDAAKICADELSARAPEAANEVRSFATYAASADLHALEELYVRTFDLNPPATLDLGFQIFGESYKRGIFLVKMGGAARARGVDPGSELADHLPVVLRLLARLEEADDPRSLVDEVVLPAAHKIAGTLNASSARRERDQGDTSPAKGAPETPYAALLRAVLSLLRNDFAIEKIRELPRLMDGPPEAANDGRRRLDIVQDA